MSKIDLAPPLVKTFTLALTSLGRRAASISLVLQANSTKASTAKTTCLSATADGKARKSNFRSVVGPRSRVAANRSASQASATLRQAVKKWMTSSTAAPHRKQVGEADRENRCLLTSRGRMMWR